MPNSQEHNHLRRQAIMIVSQLPDNAAEALTVLDYARHFVTEFLDEPSAGASTKFKTVPAPSNHR